MAELCQPVGMAALHTNPLLRLFRGFRESCLFEAAINPSPTPLAEAGNLYYRTKHPPCRAAGLFYKLHLPKHNFCNGLTPVFTAPEVWAAFRPETTISRKTVFKKIILIPVQIPDDLTFPHCGLPQPPF